MTEGELAEEYGETRRQARLRRYLVARKALSPRLSVAAFEALVADALDRLPAYIHDRMENVAVVVEERPRVERVRAMGFQADQDLLGLYEGIPRHQRLSGYHLAVPDRITLYRQPILAEAGPGGRGAIVEEIRKTVIHEVAHHFGLDDDELAELEKVERARPERCGDAGR